MVLQYIRTHALRRVVCDVDNPSSKALTEVHNSDPIGSMHVLPSQDARSASPAAPCLRPCHHNIPPVVS